MKTAATPDIATLEAAVAAAADAHTAAAEQLARYEAQLAGVRATVESHRAAKAAHDAWRLESAELGREPVVAPLADPPVAPTAQRPSDDEVLAAQSVVDEAARAAGAASQRAKDLAAAKKTAEVSAKARVAANHEAARLDAYVDALRRAPTEIAKRQKEALGDLGPVDVAFPEDGPAVELTIGGQPWYRASTGERVHADLCLRLAFRRLLGMPWLSVFLDEMQSWSGPWPELVGPVIGLRTVKTAGIRVEPFGADLTDEDVRGAGERAA